MVKAVPSKPADLTPFETSSSAVASAICKMGIVI